MSFWENVEYVREYKNISRKELAYNVNFSINSISTGISRGSFPSVELACKIAAYLDVSVEFLVYGDAFKGIQNAKEISTITESAVKKDIESKISSINKYSDLIKDFEKLPPDMQKLLSDIIHKISIK